ncbi:MAG: cytidine deaminase [Flavobacteriales bacterium]|nr:cytidine deaminase [Flavobacteriales bacterium]
MKNNQVLHINVDVYEDLNFLEDSDRSLLLKAIEISESAYAPYSNFLVGAALELSCGEIITGSNQENVAFPSGICAERTAFYYAGANYPNSKIVKVAVSAHSKQFDVNYPVSPCGACRQVMYEYESKQDSPIKVIMMGASGQVRIMQSIADLLPFTFNESSLKKY